MQTPMTIDVTGLPDAVVEDLQRLVDTLRAGPAAPDGKQPAGGRTPLRGRFDHLKLNISKEEIDEARTETWANFPREFPDPGKP